MSSFVPATGTPCWTDLWTSDTEASRRFYGELFGWEAQEASEEFGGYFMFHRDGQPVAGAMGVMGDMTPTDTWKIYFSTTDITASVERAVSAGATINFPPSPVGDLGQQTVLSDNRGAELGLWQPGSFAGFAAMGQPNAPSWFELYTDNFAKSIEFYHSVLGVTSDVLSDTDDFRYSVLRPSGETEFGGVMDASNFLHETTPHWLTYWDVDDVDATTRQVRTLGGVVIEEPTDTPYGRMASVSDCTGSAFKLRTVTR